MAGVIDGLAVEPGLAGSSIFTSTNFDTLERFISGSEFVGVWVDLEGQVLWKDAVQHQFIIQTVRGGVRVKDYYGQPVPTFGQHVRLTGHWMAGQGFLGQVLVDNDGLHSKTEKSGSIHLAAGRHSIRVDWFNGTADFFFSVDYAGPGLERQRIPDKVLFRPEGNGDVRQSQLVPGLNYRCYQGDWKRLPHLLEMNPVKTGSVTNFDLGVRSRDQAVALQFTGCLQVDREGLYTFWTESDDGSKFYIDSEPPHLEELSWLPLPKPRTISPGQTLKPGEDLFWAMAEGMLTGIHFDPGGNLELELSAGTKRMYLVSNAADFHPPSLFSRIRATGICRSAPTPDGVCVAEQILLSSAGEIEELAPAPMVSGSYVTNLEELRQLTVGAAQTQCLLCLTGTVLTATSPQGCFAFQDETGGMIVQMDRPADCIQPGRLVVLKGNGLLAGNKLVLGQVPLVDNNGTHPMAENAEKTGASYLTAGLHPIHVSWFNSLHDSGLEVYYQSPDITRTRIPASALFRPVIDENNGLKWIPGVNYKCYNGDWLSLPSVAGLEPVGMGNITNFEILVANRRENVGLEFSSFLNVPRDGLYLFSVRSDDGSRLALDEQVPQVWGVATNRLPEPFPIFSRHLLEPNQNNRWAETEGTVNFVSAHEGSLIMELESVYGPMRVEVADVTGGYPLLLPGAHVKVQGFCHAALMTDGQNLTAGMIVPGMKQVQFLVVGAKLWSHYPMEPVSNVISQDRLMHDKAIVHVHGDVQFNQSTRKLTLKDASGQIPLETTHPPATNLTGSMEILGRIIRTDTSIFLWCDVSRKLEAEQYASVNKLPQLTSVLQIKELTHEQARLRYPVKVRGVVTLVRDHESGMIIQDDTSAIDVWWVPHSNPTLPRVGDYWEVEGETSVKFSPIIESRRAVRLGAGLMPEPLRPALDQLLNGSLDTRYVEIQGIITATKGEGVTLYTREGEVRVLLSPLPGEPLNFYENALVRIRGCVVPIRDEDSQRVQVGQFRLSNMSLNVDEPAPPDLFGVGLKHVPDLLRFDAKANSLQRVKISGQIIHVHDREFYLVDGLNAIRVLSREHVSFEVGDLVEAVGFPQLDGGTPRLREANLRRIGHTPLPEPVHIPDHLLFTNSYDGMRVLVEAQLSGVFGDIREKVLQMRVGNREFLARLENRKGIMMEVTSGSRLALSGIYSEQGVKQASGTGRGVTSFELLLNSPQDVKVLQRPPWWTLKRALFFIGGMACVISVAMLWVFLLQRRVEVRSKQLEAEVLRREQIQQQNQLEKERIRIASDMHDQLGVNVTQVGLLAALIKKNIGESGELAANVERISQTAFELGRSLDEIVWAVNPKNDSLNKFCDYMAVQAQELFQLTDILCRVDLPPEMPYYPLCAEVRHNLFLAVKEALNNVVRHARAQEVWIRFELEESQFQISILDDGVGFMPEQKERLRNGLNNIQKRLEDIGGRFAIHSRTTHGTQLTLSVGISQMAEKIKGTACSAAFPKNSPLPVDWPFH